MVNTPMHGLNKARSSPEGVRTLRPWWQCHQWPGGTWHGGHSSNSGCAWTSPPCRPVSASIRGFHACTSRHTGPAHESDPCRRQSACYNSYDIPHQETISGITIMVLTNILEKNTLSFPDFPDPLNSFHTSVKRKCNLSSQSGSFIAQLQNSVFLRCMVKSPSLPVTTVTIFHIERLYLESLSWCLQIFWKKFPRFPRFSRPSKQFPDKCKV